MSLLNPPTKEKSSVIVSKDINPRGIVPGGLVPSAEALHHSQQLLNHILNEIHQNGGSISFADYMNLALYTPGLGYYTGGSQKFGAEGDFVTAPEISPLFSRCVARQSIQILEKLKTFHSNANITKFDNDILELGAGSGQMALDILLECERQNCLPDHYYILELGAELQARQKEKITKEAPHLLERITWLHSLENLKMNGVILANEVLDAMPVHRFEINKEIFLHHVYESNGKLELKLLPSDLNELQDIKINLQSESNHTSKINYTSEINLNIKPWIKSLNHILNQGAILLIDYGFPRQEYYHPDRYMGTLMCHYRHYAHHDLFLYPGLQDITAHVDFTAVAEAADEVDLEILGFCNQASFLISSGIIEMLKIEKEIEHKDNVEEIKQNQAINVLTSPAEMGELFKVMALGKNIDTLLQDKPLLGFQFNDIRYKL